MTHLKLGLRYPAALVGACACFIACHLWACKGMRPHLRAEEI